MDTVILLVCGLFISSAVCDIEQNEVNNDGTFSFRHTNNDIDSYYYHTASNSPDRIVRGRYGSRNPSNGRVEEVVYTAGPRGFRANGPQIHRKMDLSQYPRGPIGSIDDPLADPFDVPTYSFNYKEIEHERVENADANGKVTGLYSYLDDIGERHTVRYAAGANTGFEVLNAVPDASATAAYNAPLYKAPSWTRGKMATQLGKNGQYKFIAAGPDHRRAERVGADGVVRGSYSYLDDKGVQRTVEYIAGAGIGFKIIQNSVGPGTHLNPSAPVLDYTGPTNIGRVSEYKGSIGPSRTKSKDSSRFDTKSDDEYEYSGSKLSTSGEKKDPNNGSKPSYIDRTSNRVQMNFGDRINSNRGSSTFEDRTKYKGSSGEYADKRGDDNKGYRYERPNSNKSQPGSNRPSGGGSFPPLPTGNRKILEAERDFDWNQNSRDSTIVKNVGNWYIGLPPGQAIRAHVQNIDLLPIGSRVPSPSEALRQDELNDRHLN